MNLINLKCNNCNQSLQLDLDNLQAFCPYCGQKLLFDVDNLSEIVRQKEITKREEEHTKQLQMEYEYNERKQKSDDKTTLVYMFVLFGMSMFCFLIARFL